MFGDKNIVSSEIENEDLRDRIYLTTKDEKAKDQVVIEYQAYLPMIDLQKVVDECERMEDLNMAKAIILTYIFSLRKENRKL